MKHANKIIGILFFAIGFGVQFLRPEVSNSDIYALGMMCLGYMIATTKN